MRRWVFAGLTETYPLVEVDGVLASNNLLDGGLGGLLSLDGRHLDGIYCSGGAIGEWLVKRKFSSVVDRS